MKSARSKGIIFSIESFLSLLVIYSMLGLTPLLSSSSDHTLYQFIFLGDVFEVLEGGYHDDLALWLNSGVATPRLQQFFDTLAGSSNKCVSASYAQRKIVGRGCREDCKADITVYRTAITGGSRGWTGVHLALCG